MAQAFVPPLISVPATLQVYNAGAWSATVEGLAYNTADRSGSVGNLQDSALANDQTAIGGTTAYVAPNTPLWNGAGSGAFVDAGPSTLAPAFVTIQAPLPNATVSGTVAIVATVAAPSGSTVYFFDSNPTGPDCTLTAPPWTCSWNTTLYPDGQTGVTVEVQDSLGNGSWADLAVTVDNSGTTAGGTSGGTMGVSSSTSGGSSGSSSSGGGTSGSSSSGGGSSSTGSASSSASSTASSTASGSSSGGSSSSGSTGSHGSSSSGGSTTVASGSSGAGSGGEGSSSGGSESTGLSSGPPPHAVPPSSTGCGCAAGGGSPAAGLPLLILVAFGGVRRRRVSRPVLP